MPAPDKKRKARESTSPRAGDEAKIRQEVVDVARAMASSGLTPGRSGNVSARWRNGMLITPSGLPYGDTGSSDIVFMSLDGGVPAGQRKPSSEWHFHLSIYASRPDVGGIVHTHSLNATALACARRSIPAFHYMVAVTGGSDIPLVPYETFGTEALANAVAIGLRDRNACLLANHGQIAVASSPTAALELAQEVETLAAQYLRVLAIGQPHILDDEEMARVLEKFRTYGQRAHGER